MRPVSSCLSIAAAVAFTTCIAIPDASAAAGRGGGFGARGVSHGGLSRGRIARPGFLNRSGRGFAGAGFGRALAGRNGLVGNGLGRNGIGGIGFGPGLGPDYGLREGAGLGRGFGGRRGNGRSYGDGGYGYGALGYGYGGYGGYGYGGAGYGGRSGYPSESGYPVSIGIRESPVAPPAIYVIGGSARAGVSGRDNLRRGGRGALRPTGARTGIGADSEDAGAPSGVVSGPRVLPVPR